VPSRAGPQARLAAPGWPAGEVGGSLDPARIHQPPEDASRTGSAVGFMPEYLRTVPDIDWTVMRPGRLVDGDVTRPYLKEPGTPSRRYTTRRDLAKAILDDLDSGADVHQAVAVTSR
jgi:hypothetical protein